MGLTTDPSDSRLGRGVDKESRRHERGLPGALREERAKGFVRPYRAVYVHEACGSETRMGVAIAETYARNPTFYGATYCVLDGSKVGT